MYTKCGHNRCFEDLSSAANADQVCVQHIHLDWNVDFEQKIIEGKCFLDVEALEDATEVILDARDLKITKISANNSDVPYKIEEFGVLGQKLTLQFPLSKGDKEKIEIHYSTSKEGASALQFLEKELTADKTQPYLYSQCEAIHCRSIVPCMDTPSVKQTYSAEVTVPKEFVCLMSALDKGSESKGDKTLFRFDQPVVIPAYLIAIVVGDLEKRDISERCCVWAEPSVVEKARWEFEDTEKMLQAAEQLMGKYEWGRYDLVVLPNTFPFGGMENPCLTFVTPTIIAGDRSLANVVAHEIAHSWTGNLITNSNWEHFWLNEGFTVFVERKILGRLYGEDSRDFATITGWEDRLLTTINDTFSPVHEYTKLIPRLGGEDPDSAFSTIPYEKGSAFLLYLEQILGTSDQFEEMLRAYIRKFRQQSITTADWIDFLKEYYTDKQDVLDKVDFDGWLNKPGVPPNKPQYNEALVAECIQLAEIWSKSETNELSKTEAQTYNELSANQKIKVLDSIETGPVLSHERVALLEEAYNLKSCQNSEVMFSFLLIGIKAKWPAVIQKSLDFIKSNGRIKFLRPLYKKLFDWPESRQLAISTFEKNKPYMHPITVIVVKSQM